MTDSLMSIEIQTHKKPATGVLTYLRNLSSGMRCSLPVLVIFVLGFIAPLVSILAFSVAEPRSFDVFTSFTL
ncbi:MAG: hypothetical protein WA138_00650, partial [Parvibaculum sp.]